MTTEQKEPWVNFLAMSTIIFAVCATLSTFKGGGYSTLSILSQTQASDQWAFYQAKSMKSNLYEISQEQLSLQIQSLPANTSPEVKAQFEARLAEYSGKVAKYEKEKVEIKAKAEELETTRDQARAHSKPFGLAVIFLQVAILLSSIAGLLKKKLVWYAALPIGAVGLVFFANGFLVFF